MPDQALSFEAALAHPNKAAVTEVDATVAASLAGIEELTGLVSLDLTGNKNIVDFRFLQHLPALRELYMADMGLGAIPPEVATLEQLTKLLIGKTDITDLSPLDVSRTSSTSASQAWS